ncbi:hypothetical protein QNN00_11500 [Bacillus velezensis]|nr:hypothetical protein [Bacillus velezensis]
MVLNSRKIKHLTKQSVSNINSLKYPGIYGVYMKDSKETNIAAHLLGATNQDPELLKRNTPAGRNCRSRQRSGQAGWSGRLMSFYWRIRTQNFVSCRRKGKPFIRNGRQIYG